jgi:CheY-like chemotaxis protein
METIGIDIAIRKKPDIIIIDVRLSDIRGTEAAKILRQDKETADIPIVFVTASVMADGIEEIKNITDSGFIGKPINPCTFAKGISQFIRKDN